MSDGGKPAGRFAPTDNKVAFFGRITASVTHELNNVISIIEQTAGLLDDLVAGEERGVPITMERLTSISASIQKQTGRGLGIIENLNRFSHSTDSTETEFDINEVGDNLVNLCHRLASLRKIRLEYRPAESPCRIIGDPFAVQRALFEAILIALRGGPQDTTVSVEVREADDAVGVSIGYRIAEKPSSDQTDHLKEVLAAIGGGLNIETNASATRLLLRFPRRPSR